MAIYDYGNCEIEGDKQGIKITMRDEHGHVVHHVLGWDDIDEIYTELKRIVDKEIQKYSASELMLILRQHAPKDAP